MKEVAEDEGESSDISGYHSDSDSAIMMSGNSPYVSKRARYNFLTRSGIYTYFSGDYQRTRIYALFADRMRPKSVLR